MQLKKSYPFFLILQTFDIPFTLTAIKRAKQEELKRVKDYESWQRNDIRNDDDNNERKSNCRALNLSFE